MDCQLVIAHRVCPVLSAKAVGFRTILDLVRAGAESMRKALWRLPFLFAVALRMLLHLPVREALRQQARIWMRHPLAVLSAPRFRLWGPVPTLAVHVCDNSLPPGAAAYFATASAEEVERLVQRHLRPYPAFG